MTVKIGVHLSPGSPTGIGQWMADINKAGVSFALKSVDHFGYVYEAAKKGETFGISNELIFRFSSNNTFHYDVPNYFLNPWLVLHFLKILAELGAGFLRCPTIWSYMVEFGLNLSMK